MAHRLIKQPEVILVPGKDPVVGWPDHYITVREVIGKRYYEAKTETVRTCMSEGDYQWMLLNRPPHSPAPPRCHTSKRVIPAGYRNIYREKQVFVPGKASHPGYPARVDKAASNGWNAGARSITKLEPQQYIELQVRPNPIAILVGLSGVVKNYSYSALKHAVVFRTEGVKGVSGGLDDDGLHPASTLLRIERSLGAVRYLANGNLIKTFNADDSEQLYCYALLYSMGDYVSDPKIGALPLSGAVASFSIESSIDAVLQGTSMFSIQSNALPSVNGAAHIKGTSVFFIRSSGSIEKTVTTGGEAPLSIASHVSGLGVFSAGSDGLLKPKDGTSIEYAAGALAVSGKGSSIDYCVGSGVYPAPRIEAIITRAEQLAMEAVGAFSANRSFASILNGGVLSGEAKLKSVGKGSDTPYFGGIAGVSTRYDIFGFFAMTPDGIISNHEQVEVADYFALDSSLFFAFYEGVSIEHSLDIYLIVSMAMHEMIGVDEELSFSAMLEIIIREGVSISPTSSVARQEAMQYAVNALTGALSRYSNFGFNQFAVSAGVTYAITDSGLYELSGNTDENDAIQASIDFGASDFGTAQSKRVSSVYAGIDTDGEVYIRVAGDGAQEAVYRAISYGSESRAVTAKGLSARHWRVRLELIDATVADLDNTEIEIGVSQRRLGGRGGR